jgi:hypothetical protein
MLAIKVNGSFKTNKRGHIKRYGCLADIYREYRCYNDKALKAKHQVEPVQLTKKELRDEEQAMQQ